jgi:SAM-dependent methyltransferase
MLGRSDHSIAAPCAPPGGSDLITMHSKESEHGNGRDLVDRNRRFYDSLWDGARLIEPQRFNTWPLVRSLALRSGPRLEVAPGLRPRLPLEQTQFLDISGPALAKLRERGAQVVQGELTALPFADGAFELVCALDIVEHVDDEDGALRELSRVARPGGALLISVPLHPERWSPFDDFVGHKRRYEPSRLLEKLAEHQLTVEQSAMFGMQPKSSRLLDLGMYWMQRNRDRAMWWYNWAIMPLGMHFQKELQFASGMIPADDIDEVILVCRRGVTAPA